jgi:type IV pilus assembly protein PilC
MKIVGRYIKLQSLFPHSKQKRLLAQMAGMLRRGYPLSRILESLAGVSHKYRQWLLRMARQVREGATLSMAMKKDWVAVPPIVGSLVDVGEKQGALPKILTLACELNDPDQLPGQRFKLFGLTLYFFFVGVFLLGMVMVLVVPVFEEMFASFGRGLPYLTQLTVGVSRTVGRYSLPLVLVFTAAFVLIRCHARWVYRWRLLYGIVERIPLAGRYFRYSRWWKMLYGLGGLMKAGVPLEDAVKAMGRGLRMPAMVQASDRISTRLAQGMDLAEALRAEKIFPTGISWAVAVAEAGGDIPDTLVTLGAAYRGLAQGLMGRLAAGINVLILLVIVWTICGIIVSMYLPIFGMATHWG